MKNIDFSRWRDLNPYEWVRPILFRFDAEQIHDFTLKLLKRGFGPRFKNNPNPLLVTNVCGLNFPNPIGLAAGFDRQAEIISEMFGFGFGFIELGGVAPKPQPGNPRPRLFRLAEAEAIINRYGFNSDGFDVCLRRIVAWCDEHSKKRPGPIGINIGANKTSLDLSSDFAEGIKLFAPYLDYLTVNISSPNTPGLRDLQKREFLTELLSRVVAARDATHRQPPLFVKIAPDLTEAQADDIAELVMASGVNGLIVGNTTVTRPAGLPPTFAAEAGGLSGRPLFTKSTKVLAHMYKATGGKLPLIGCGGVSSGADAYVKIRAGASLVQLYSALIFAGPLLIPRLNRELAALLTRDGFKSVAEAVGTAAL